HTSRLARQFHEQCKEPTEPKTADELVQHTAKVLSQRRQIYGSPNFGHSNVGLIWTALLQNHYNFMLPHPVSGQLVCTMMAGTKINRLAIPGLCVDDATDLAGYAGLAYEC